MQIPAFIIGGLLAATALSVEIELNGQKFTLPDGFEIEDIAGSELVERPVSADFDERGRLYVTDSSGSNEAVEIQREKRPHRIMRLVDEDGDGKFDTSTLFADRLMFPEGSLWFDGSLYVAAPPEIWKFTDADDDGVAENREIWFDGKTLTHCANDLHGPYLGPDGWIYWCKGAFAEQTYERPGQPDLRTNAAHIFRRRPEGGPIESVMTGGMDNPVEVIFTPGGERIFTTTFLVNPGLGLRDGLLHAVYGGVYGKKHAAIKGHPRTGDLMPVLSHLGVAAPCGLARLESEGLGSSFRNNVLACSFNMHKVTRHVLTQHGATFASETTDLLVSNDLDFHPTDVVEDADGSVLVVDTGGWFRLCCPTSQLEKPDVLGRVYRIRQSGIPPVVDPRGQRISWNGTNEEELVELLRDPRAAVRHQARQQIGKRGSEVIPALQRVLESSSDVQHRLQAVWALTWIDGPDARKHIRKALLDDDETVRQAAIHSVSVHRDTVASDQLRTMLKQKSAHNRRAAAEALGRVGSAKDIPLLLSTVSTAFLPGEGSSQEQVDRFLEHSLIFAAMELNAPDVLRRSITDSNERTRRAALIALDQIEGDDHLSAADIRELLISKNELLNEIAWWIAEQHPDWGNNVVDAFHRELRRPPADGIFLQRLGDRLRRFAASSGVQQVMADVLQNINTSPRLRKTILEAMADSRVKPMPALWQAAVREQLSGNKQDIRAALKVLSRLDNGQSEIATIAELQKITTSESALDPDIRLQAINLIPAASREITPAVFEFICSQLDTEFEVTNRSLAVDILKSTELDSVQLQHVARQLPTTGVMELRPLMELFTKSKNPRVGAVLIESLLKAPAATTLFPDRLMGILSSFGDNIAAEAIPLLTKIEHENGDKLQRVEAILALLPHADVRRGLRVFQNPATSCIACHRRAYLGGHIGPDLSRIGQARSERDLLESILFPSLTFVRNYEPVSIVTTNGLVYNGVVRDETDNVVTLQLDAKKSVQIPRAEIEERRLGKTSIMPAGLEKQISPQDLADLLKYLKQG